MNVGTANTNPNTIAIKNATRIFWENKDIPKKNRKNAEKTTIVAHFVLAILRAPVRSSCLYINMFFRIFFTIPFKIHTTFMTECDIIFIFKSTIIAFHNYSIKSLFPVSSLSTTFWPSSAMLLNIIIVSFILGSDCCL